MRVSAEALVRRAVRVPPAVRSLLRPSLGYAAQANALHALEHLHDAMSERAALQGPGERHVQRLSLAETLDVLLHHSVGRYAYVAREGVPDVVPVNYTWKGGAALIRSGPGPKLQAAQRGEWVVLEVDEVDESTRTGRSVVVAGRAEVVAPWEMAGDVRPWAGGPRRHLIRIVPTRVEGRRLS